MKLGFETKIMGVLNVTPDSFSDGGLYLDPGLAEECALRMQIEGAHILDIGGESSRPGAFMVSTKEELRRILPVIKRLSKKIKIPLSVDTYKTEVAKAAIQEGVSMVNDIFALRKNKPLAKLIARHKTAVVLMHMQGTPATMQKKPSYKNLLQEVSDYLYNASRFARDNGISEEQIILDPGFGFGKTIGHNLALLHELDFFEKLNHPLLVGLSRKSFIGHLIGGDVSNRLNGSLAAASAAILSGVHILRVHDVLAHKELTLLLDALMDKK